MAQACRLRQQTFGLLPDHLVAFATQVFEARPVQHRDLVAAAADGAELVQLAGRPGDALAAHAKHVGDLLVRDDQPLPGQMIVKAQ